MDFSGEVASTMATEVNDTDNAEDIRSLASTFMMYKIG